MTTRPTRVLFLDIDGVLNSNESCSLYGTFERLSPRCIAALQRILDETGADLVISSTWRLHHKRTGMCDVLNEAGLQRFLVRGITPDLTTRSVDGRPIIAAKPRCDEIRAWLNANLPVQSWVALDDSSDAGPERLVLTDFAVGLTEANADEAIKILRTPIV